MQGEIDNPLLELGASASLYQKWRGPADKISKDIVELNSTIDQLDIIDIYQLGNPNIPEYAFLSSSHETFTKLEHILGNKTHLNKFKRLEIT